MIYFITVTILFISLYLYFPVAEKYKLLAGVNNRSSHKKPVITGAGFIFYLSYIILFTKEYYNYNIIINKIFPFYKFKNKELII